MSNDKITHGLNIDNFPDPREGEETIALGSHQIEYDGSFTIFECVHCDTSFEVPDIFQSSTDFNQIVYQLLILSHFKEEECPEPAFEIEDLPDPTSGGRNDRDWPPAQSPGVGDVMFQNGSVMEVDVKNGSVVTDGRVIHESTSPDYHAGDMVSSAKLAKKVMDNQNI